MPKDTSALRTLSLAAAFTIGTACTEPPAKTQAPPPKEPSSSPVASSAPVAPYKTNQNFTRLKDLTALTRDKYPVTFDFGAVHRAGVYRDGEFDALVAEKAKAVIGRHNLKELDGNEDLKDTTAAVKRTLQAKDTTLEFNLPSRITNEVARAIAPASPVTCHYRIRVTGKDGEEMVNGKVRVTVTADQLRAMAGLKKKAGPKPRR